MDWEQGAMAEGKVVRVGRRTLAVSRKAVKPMRLGGTDETQARGIAEQHGLGVPLRVERARDAGGTMTLPNGDAKSETAGAPSALTGEALCGACRQAGSVPSRRDATERTNLERLGGAAGGGGPPAWHAG